MALGLTQNLRKMNTRCISLGKVVKTAHEKG
jgi:hypothetical protein